jgi:hypothetical protein
LYGGLGLDPGLAQGLCVWRGALVNRPASNGDDDVAGVAGGGSGRRCGAGFRSGAGDGLAGAGRTGERGALGAP